MVFGGQRGSWGATSEHAAAIVKRFGQAGGNFIDTANYYAGGESERIVEELIRSDRDRWVLASECALSADPAGPNAGGSHRKSLRRAIDASLTGLGTDYIDLYWLHIWDAFTPVEEVISALDDRCWARTQAIATWLALASRAPAIWLTASAIARFRSESVRCL